MAASIKKARMVSAFTIVNKITEDQSLIKCRSDQVKKTKCAEEKKNLHVSVWYVARTNQIAALGYVSRTNQIAALGYVSCTNHIMAFDYLQSQRLVIIATIIVNDGLVIDICVYLNVNILPTTPVEYLLIQMHHKSSDTCI